MASRRPNQAPRPVDAEDASSAAAAQPREAPADDFKPYIPASTVLPEMTVKVFVVGIILAWVMSSANAYLGLYVGLTVSAAIPASVVSMAVLRFFKQRNILENNLIQTTASAGESVVAGIIFVLPALLFIGYWNQIGIWETIIIAALGGSLGVLFTIPLRRAYIVDARLQYPEGVATVEVLKSGERGGSGAGYILLAGLSGALFKFMESGLNMWRGIAEYATRAGNVGFYFATTLSPALVAVGFIVGLNIAVLIFMGGALNWLLAIPAYMLINGWPTNEFGSPLEAAQAFGVTWRDHTRFIGIGAMTLGGVYTLFKLRSVLVKGFKSGLDAYRAVRSGGPAQVRTERDMNMKTLLVTLGLFLLPLTALFTYFLTEGFRDMGPGGVRILIGLLLGIVMMLMGFLFSAVAGYMAGVVGSSNNPISGTAIGTILFTALLLFLLQIPGDVGPAAAILIGSTVACAAAIAGDNMQDLKAGYLLGGTPKNLQIMQMVGAIAAAFTIPFVLILLHKAYTIGGPDLRAPQARVMQSLITGTFNPAEGNIPWDLFALGAVLGVAIIVIDLWLQVRKARFRMPVLAVAVGLYLPLDTTSAIFLGGLVAFFAARAYRRQVRSQHPQASPAAVVATVERRQNRGVLFASGIIAGEALMGILVAGLLIAGDKESPLAVLSAPQFYWTGGLLFVYLGFLLYHSVTRGGVADRPHEEPPRAHTDA